MGKGKNAASTDAPTAPSSLQEVTPDTLIATSSSSPRKIPVRDASLNKALQGHPETLDTFYMSYPEFLVAPILFALMVKVTQLIPAVSSYLEANGMSSYGFSPALQLLIFGLLLSYAGHSFVILFAPSSLKIQTSLAYDHFPVSMAVRSTAVIFSNLVYAVYPLGGTSTSWMSFVAWIAGVSIVYDAWFFGMHKWFHENPNRYKYFHKLHHLVKDPNPFSAYFVTYQSHFATEHLPLLLIGMAGMPVDAFSFWMAYGYLGTLLEHSGYEMGTMKLPCLPITLGQVEAALSFYAIGWLEGVNTAEHDWHHEKFTTNYALSFKYLDKLFGSYHPGRVPGAAPDKLKLKGERASYTALRDATVEDFEKQGRACDAYAARGAIVDNVLGLVINMKGKNGDIGCNVDMFEHSLQTATRARRDGADVETIVCALLHDIGEVLSGTNHGEIPASILRPYITPKNAWVLSNHEVFQAYFYLDKCGGDKDLRDKVKEWQEAGIVPGHEYYEACAEFCERYDQPSFDREYDTDTLESFRPLVAEVLGKDVFWWEEREGDDMDCKARLAAGYSLTVRDSVEIHHP